MTRRTFLLALTLSPKDRHNRQCERMAARRAGNGYRPRERRTLEQFGCKEENGVWMSGKVWEA